VSACLSPRPPGFFRWRCADGNSRTIRRPSNAGSNAAGAAAVHRRRTGPASGGQGWLRTVDSDSSGETGNWWAKSELDGREAGRGFRLRDSTWFHWDPGAHERIFIEDDSMSSAGMVMEV